MKKTLLFLSIMILGITSCTETEYIQPEPVENPNVAFIVDLAVSDWDRVSNGMIQVDIPLRDLTEYYILQGNVAVALSFDGEESYDLLPTTVDGLAYSVNYRIGMITIVIDDPLAQDVQTTPLPSGPVVAKIILSSADYLDYQGLFNTPTPGINFQKLELK